MRMQKNSPDLIAETKKVWQPYFEDALNDKDAEEIIQRWAAFIKVASQALETKS